MYDYLFMLGLKLIDVSKKGPWWLFWIQNISNSNTIVNFQFNVYVSPQA